MKHAFNTRPNVASGRKFVSQHPALKIPAHSHLAVGALARDCRKRIPKMLKRLEEIGRHFASVSVFLLENGSKDGTREALERWSPKGITKQLLPEPVIPDLGPSSPMGFPYSFFDRKRIGKMSFLRNLCLDAIRRDAGFADYVLLIDMDIHDFSVEGVLSCFDAEEEWDVVTANGLEYDRVFGSRVYRDAYAYQAFGDRGPKVFDDLGPVQRSLPLVLAEDSKLLRVDAAFGGLAFFRAPAIFSARYQLTENRDGVVAYECEHISLFRQMRENGCDRVFVSPRMKLYYNSRIEKLFQELRMSARKFVPRIFERKT